MNARKNIAINIIKDLLNLKYYNYSIEKNLILLLFALKVVEITKHFNKFIIINIFNIIFF